MHQDLSRADNPHDQVAVRRKKRCHQREHRPPGQILRNTGIRDELLQHHRSAGCLTACGGSASSRPSPVSGLPPEPERRRPRGAMLRGSVCQKRPNTQSATAVCQTEPLPHARQGSALQKTTWATDSNTNRMTSFIIDRQRANHPMVSLSGRCALRQDRIGSLSRRKSVLGTPCQRQRTGELATGFDVTIHAGVADIAGSPRSSSYNDHTG
jgi:hypothetical protein